MHNGMHGGHVEADMRRSMWRRATELPVDDGKNFELTLQWFNAMNWSWYVLYVYIYIRIYAYTCMYVHDVEKSC
jgi:hypothetical protein